MFSTLLNQNMEITLTITPTPALTAEHLAKITEAAERLGITPEQFVANALLEALKDPTPQNHAA